MTPITYIDGSLCRESNLEMCRSILSCHNDWGPTAANWSVALQTGPPKELPSPLNDSTHGEIPIGNGDTKPRYRLH